MHLRSARIRSQLKLSSDAGQTTLPGGHDLAEENSKGVVAEIRKLLDAIEE